jgi:hypothetical protein
MKGITRLLRRTLKQTAVYWGNPVNQGDNFFTYDDPIEIPCRWEEKTQLIKDWDAKGREFECVAMVYVLQDLDKHGILMLGALADLDSSGDSSGVFYDPTLEPNAFEIKQFQKIPSLGSTTEFVRTAFLSNLSYR